MQNEEAFLLDLTDRKAVRYKNNKGKYPIRHFPLCLTNGSLFVATCLFFRVFLFSHFLDDKRACFESF